MMYTQDGKERHDMTDDRHVGLMLWEIHWIVEFHRPTRRRRRRRICLLPSFSLPCFVPVRMCVCVLKEGGARATWNQHNGGWGISQTFPSFSFLDIIREGNQIHIATRTNGWMDGWTSTRRSTSIVVDAVDLQRGLHTYKELLIN